MNFSINNPLDLWQDAPGNLFCEVQMLLLFAICTYDVISSNLMATSNSGKHDTASNLRRTMLVVYLSSVLCSIITESLTLLHPQISNFWHGQFTFMLIDNHEPLYMITGVYNWFAYCVIYLILQMKIEHWYIEYGLMTIVSNILWQPLDQIGMKYLWWTWHTDEYLYIDRHLDDSNVPIASTFWLQSHLSALVFLMRIYNWYYDKQLYKLSLFKLIVLLPILTAVSEIIVMQIPFYLFYHPFVTYKGYHAIYAMNISLYVCVFIVCTGILWHFINQNIRIRIASFSDIWHDKSKLSLLVQLLGLYYGVYILILVLFNPEDVKQSSFHQPLAPTSLQLTKSEDVKINVSSSYSDFIYESSFWGMFHRSRYIFIENHINDRNSNHYTLTCTIENVKHNDIVYVNIDPISVIKYHQNIFNSFSYYGNARDMNSVDQDGFKWYTICGTPLTNAWIYKFARLLGVGTFLILFCCFVSFQNNAIEVATVANKKSQ